MTEQTFNITVHWLNGSRAQRILVLLEEINLKYEIITYQRDKNGMAPPELEKIHPLKKSPVISIDVPGQKSIILAESAVICDYLVSHWGQHLIPEKWNTGKVGQIGGETEEWTRVNYFLNYSESSLMPLVAIAAVIQNIKNAPVPFFIRPITKMIAGRVTDDFIGPNFTRHFDFLEAQLASAPNGGGFLAGKDPSTADIMIVFPLQLCQEYSGFSKTSHPKLTAFLEIMVARDSYKRAENRIIKAAGEFNPVF